MKIRTLSVIAILSVQLLFTSFAYSQNSEPNLKSRFGDWRLFNHSIGDENYCYISSAPIKQHPTDKQWKPSFFIARFDGEYNQPSLYADYVFKEDSIVTIKILNSTFMMATDNNRAWLISQDEEEKLVEAMKKGYQMVIQGTSKFDTETTDTYSLKGVTRSIQELDDGC